MCATYYIDLLFSLIFLIICGFYYYWVNKHLPNPFKKEDPKILAKYESLIRDVVPTSGFFSVRLMSITLSFKFCYALSLAALANIPQFQALAAIVLNGIVCLLYSTAYI